MFKATTLAILATAITASVGLAQGTLYKVTDQYGNVTYQDRPPNDDSRYEEREIPLEEAAPAAAPADLSGSGDTDRMAQVAESRPLVLFTVPKCDACDFVRWYLKERELPFEEVDVQSDIDNQLRLREATGEYRVPVLMVGDLPLFGYDGDDLAEALGEAGYLDSGATEGSPDAPPGEAAVQ